MSTALKGITLAEYAAREKSSDIRSEYFRGEMFSMAGGSPEHSLIASNFIREAGNELKGKPCIVYNSELRVKIDATGLYTYPDVSIVCGTLDLDSDIKDTALNPIVLVEVLSDSTEKYDRGKKASHYRQIPTLRELVLITQDSPRVERFVRQSSGGWLLIEYTTLGESVELECIDIRIPMSEIYRNITFKPEPRPPVPSNDVPER